MIHRTEVDASESDPFRWTIKSLKVRSIWHWIGEASVISSTGNRQALKASNPTLWSMTKCTDFYTRRQRETSYFSMTLWEPPQNKTVIYNDSKYSPTWRLKTSTVFLLSSLGLSHSICRSVSMTKPCVRSFIWRDFVCSPGHQHEWLCLNSFHECYPKVYALMKYGKKD